MEPASPMVSVPWGRKSELPREVVERAYESCQRGKDHKCINSQLTRAFADHQGRTTRHLHTLNGDLRWSELVDGVWCMFSAPLTYKYALKVDAFDKLGKHFRVPVKCPMGPVEFRGYCVERHDPPEIVRERKARQKARIDAGEMVPREKFRRLQAPIVAARQ